MKSFYQLFFFLPFINLQIDGHYERHIQYCGGLSGTDYRWELEIKKDNTFILEITSKKNVYLSKPKYSFMSGQWQTISDTLRLYKWGNNEVIVLRMDKSKLIYLRNESTSKGRELLYLDYFEKPLMD